MGIPPLNVSHHQTVLKTAGLIAGRQSGRFVIYSLSDGVLNEIVATGIPKEVLDLGCGQLLADDEKRPGC